MLKDNIVKYRKESGLSQLDVAKRLNVVRQTVSKWEIGVSSPDAELLIKLAEVLGVSVGELVGEREGTEEETKPNKPTWVKTAFGTLILAILLGAPLYCLIYDAGHVQATVILAVVIAPAPFVFERLFSENGYTDKKCLIRSALFSLALLLVNIGVFFLLDITRNGTKLLFLIVWWVMLLDTVLIPTVHAATVVFILSRRGITKGMTVLIYTLTSAVFLALTAGIDALL